ncbi:MAG: CdaR family protein [Patescibacteria group bacterium]|jgi:YbbR domain-containing protein
MKLTSVAQLGLFISAAILIWLAVFSLSYHAFILEVPIKITNLKSGWAVAEDLTTVQATIRAKNMAYYQLKTAKSLEAIIDLDFVQGLGNYNVKPQLTLGVSDVWLIGYTPEIITINIVPAVAVTVPVLIDPQGFPANGYALEDTTVSPSEVTIIGPADLVNTLQQAYVVVDISNKQNSYSAKGNPEVRDTAGRSLSNIKFNPAEVNVSVTIVKGEMFKTVGLVPAFAGSLPAGYWIAEVTFDPPAVTLRSSVKRLEAINSVTTTRIDLTGKTTDFSDQVGIEVPAGVSLVGEKLVNVNVKIGSSPFNRKLVLVPHGVNVTPGFKVVSMSPATVNVNLAGPAEDLNKADRNTVVLDLDLREATSGDNVVKLTAEMFRVPEKLSVISFDPPTLQVTLTKTN